MRNLHWRIAAAALLAGGLAACGGDSSTPAQPPTPAPAPAAKLEDQFGTNFGVAYRNNPNTDATDPTAGDIVPLSLTTDAVTL